MTQLNDRFSTSLTILMVSCLECASTSKQSGTGEYFDDTAITTNH